MYLIYLRQREAVIACFNSCKLNKKSGIQKLPNSYAFDTYLTKARDFAHSGVVFGFGILYRIEIDQSGNSAGMVSKKGQ